MNDEKWLRELAQAAQEEEESDRMQLDERWDRLSAGELSAREDEELRALAETSPEARQAYEAFRPLGPEFKERTLRALREKIASPGLAPVIPMAKAPRRRSLPWRSRRLAGGVAAAAAVAAAAVLMLRIPGRPLPPLPEYGESLQGGVVTMRGSQGGVPGQIQTFRQGSRLDLALTPSSAVQRKIAADCFFVRGSQLRPCKGNLQPVGQGVFEIVGTIGKEIQLDPGEWTLCAVVGWPGKLPEVAALCSQAGQAPLSARSWQAWKIPLRVE